MSNTIDIKLLGKDYRVSCAPEEHESLTAAVAFLDGRLAEISTSTRSTGERLAMMAALNLAHELLTLKSATTENNVAVPLESASILTTMKNIETKLDDALEQLGSATDPVTDSAS